VSSLTLHIEPLEILLCTLAQWSLVGLEPTFLSNSQMLERLGDKNREEIRLTDGRKV
jgi:hypothetical protein